MEIDAAFKNNDNHEENSWNDTQGDTQGNSGFDYENDNNIDEGAFVDGLGSGGWEYQQQEWEWEYQQGWERQLEDQEDQEEDQDEDQLDDIDFSALAKEMVAIMRREIRDRRFSDIVRTLCYEGAAKVYTNVPGKTFLQKFEEHQLALSREAAGNVYFPWRDFLEWQFANILMRMRCSLAEKTELLNTELVSSQALITKFASLTYHFIASKSRHHL